MQPKPQGSHIQTVVAHDTIQIPRVSSLVISGTTTATTASKLVDSGVDFEVLGVAIGDVIYNTTDGTAVTVTAIDSATTLSISSDKFTITEDYEIYNKTTDGVLLAIGVAGNVKVTSVGGQTKIFKNLLGGTILPVQITQLWETGTTATTFIGIS